MGVSARLQHGADRMSQKTVMGPRKRDSFGAFGLELCQSPLPGGIRSAIGRDLSFQ